ncbi:MAG: hypothetical protein ACE5FM_04780 [Methyloligellaceae bacterium]
MACYSFDDGTIITRKFRAGTRPPGRIRHKGKLGLRDWSAEHRPHGGRNCQGKWPLLSDALGVHPLDIPRAEKHAAEIGIPTEFTKDGRCKLRNAGHRARYGKALGFYDRNSYGTSKEITR